MPANTPARAPERTQNTKSMAIIWIVDETGFPTYALSGVSDLSVANATSITLELVRVPEYIKPTCAKPR